MLLTVHVTQEHIDAAQDKNSAGNPLALAIRDATGRGDVTVTLNAAIIDDTHYVLPRIARRYIRLWYGGTPMDPFRFAIPGYQPPAEEKERK